MPEEMKIIETEEMKKIKKLMKRDDLSWIDRARLDIELAELATEESLHQQELEEMERKGKREGIREGKREGIKEGKEKMQEKVLRVLIKKGIDDETIMEALECDLDTIIIEKKKGKKR